MGMAASQARLLSITTRMSDNELRAQMINNSKMRLATESSQASASYVSALNQSTMMIANTDTSGNSQFQQLSFNTLTQYSPTNTQYGLVNASGRLMVSEREARLFEQTKDVNKYLESHGLVFKSTYFDAIKKHQDDNGNVKGFDLSADALKQLYFGVEAGPDSIDGKSHYGYAVGYTSSEYLKYDKLINAYDSNKKVFMSSSKPFLKKQINNFGTAPNFGELIAAIAGIKTDSTDLGTIKGYIGNFRAILNAAAPKINGGIDGEYYQSIIGQMDRFEKGDEAFETAWGENKNILKVYLPTGADGSGIGNYTKITKKVPADAENPYIFEFCDSDGNVLPIDEENDGSEVLSWNKDTQQFTYTIYGYNEDDSINTNEYYKEVYNIPTNWGTGEKPTQCTVKTTLEPSDEATIKAEYKSFLTELTTYFSNTVYDQIKIFDFAKPDGSFEDTEMQAASGPFIAAARALSQFIFGTDGNRDTWLRLDDVEYIKDTGVYKEDFRPIIDLVTLENLFDEYGEPKDTWIYTDPNKTGNAEAEAKWYTNLFERMKAGYKTIENGLASSNEWIQYALESGLLSMEQVDKDNKWQSTMYANVSTITEKTNDLQTTVAEADYNRSMNRIQSKDKQFDMELKNIDTEHNSLQTEYDSVKSVIDKNVERNFKLYS